MLTSPSSRLLAIATIVFAANVTQAAQTHLYEFNGTLNDSLGGPSLVSNGGTLDAGSYSFAANQGLSLTGALTQSVYSVDITFSFGTKDSWSKILDFKDLIADSGWYKYGSGSVSVLQICPCSGAVNSASGAFTDNQSLRVTLTRDASNMVTQYVNGSVAGTFADPTGIFTFNQPGSVAHFFIDDHATNQGEAAAGSVSRIVIFNEALNASQVANISAVPEPQTAAMMLAGLAMLGGIVIRRRKIAA